MTTYRASGYWHLTGMTVQVVIDGAYIGDVVVNSNGEVDIDTDAYEAADEKIVTAGLSYNQDLETLPPGWEGVEALGQAKEKNISKVFARVHKTVAIKAGPDFNHLREYPPRAAEPYGDGPALKSQYIEIPIDPEWDVDGTVCIRNDDPLPVTITGLVLELEV